MNSNDEYSDRLVLVDVGGLGGLQECWKPHVDKITPIIFEPNPPEAEAIRRTIVGSSGRVVECALSDRKEKRILNVAKSLGCTSVLKPNFSFLAPYSVAPAFRTTHVLEIDCVRYDEIENMPPPDAMKIDVQGFEYQVLCGFGDLLQGCLGVQLEAHIYPIYEEQMLLHDLVRYLNRFGLSLRRLEPVPHFDGDMVEVDAWFTRDIASLASLGDRARAKLDLISEVWEIPRHRKVFGNDQFS